MKKITIWGMSLMPAMKPMIKKNRTSRLVFPVNVTGQGMTLRFSNRYGRKAGEINHVKIAKCDAQGNLMLETSKDVTFHGKQSTMIQPGENLVSDEINIHVDFGDYLAISVYCRKKPDTTTGLGEYAFIAEQPGDACDSYITKDLDKEAKMMSKGQAPVYMIPYLHGIDLMTEEDPMVLSCLGDSITQQCKWFAPLQKKLYARFPGQLCMINHGICGNQFITDARGIMKMFGEAGEKRAEWDTFADAGVTNLLLAMGVNDIGLGKIPANVFAEHMKAFAEKARKKQMTVASLSVFPAKMGGKKWEAEEAMRLQYNEALGNCGLDQIFYMDDYMKAKDHVGYKDGYSTGDGLHLSHAGGQAMAQGVYEEIEKWLDSRGVVNVSR